MPSTSSTTQATSSPEAGVVAASAERNESGMLVRALGTSLLVLLVLGLPTWFILFREGAQLSNSVAYFTVGLGAAVFAALISVWLSGRITARRTAAAGGDAAMTARLEGMRLQGLMAAGFGAKLVVLTIGVFALRAFPLRINEVAADVKFVDLLSFAVTFAGASLVMQLITAASIARSLRRREPAN